MNATFISARLSEATVQEPLHSLQLPHNRIKILRKTIPNDMQRHTLTRSSDQPLLLLARPPRPLARRFQVTLPIDRSGRMLRRKREEQNGDDVVVSLEIMQ